MMWFFKKKPEPNVLVLSHNGYIPQYAKKAGDVYVVPNQHSKEKYDVLSPKPPPPDKLPMVERYRAACPGYLYTTSNWVPLTYELKQYYNSLQNKEE